ncbi:MAG: hypothetical protein E6433_10490 [Streptococcus agalactiae]|nr:hypothetical protein [Streptococcus agalactiae]
MTDKIIIQNYALTTMLTDTIPPYTLILRVRSINNLKVSSFSSS